MIVSIIHLGVAGNPAPSGVSMETNFFNRLNQAEPFVAIRFLILQAGIAIGLYWTGNATGDIPEDLALFPLNLMGIFNTQAVLGFGYPMREVIWSGEWWRLPIGVFLPPGLGWFAFSVIALLPLGKMMEEEIGRLPSLMIYLLGGAVVVLVDYTSSAVITAGSLGMIFSAGGTVLVKLGFDRREGPEKLAVVPGGTWMALLLLWLFSWTLSYAPPYRPSIEFASITQIGPTQKALIAALMMGAACSLPILVFQRLTARSVFPDQPKSRTGLLTGLLTLVPVAGIVGLSLYSLHAWNHTGSIDHTLWREDPLLEKGDPDSQARVQELALAHTEDLFLAKRLAVSYASNRQYPQASEMLDTLSSQMKGKEKDTGFQARYLSRRFRTTSLNWRGSGEMGPWRQSGFSGNYDVDPLRILWDKGHVARLRGATAELESLRDRLFHVLEPLIPPLTPDKEEDPLESKQRQSMVLNHRAYVRCELGGDLATAIQEATLSVSLVPSGDNLDTLGWIEVRQGKIDTGITHLEKALLYDDPHSAGTIHFHLGMAFHRKGDIEEASEHFRQALKYNLEWWDQMVLRETCPDCLSQKPTTS